jgi:hypothetical protein
LDKKSLNEQAIGQHINALGLKSVDSYQKWCRDNGFSVSLNKPYQQRSKEIKFLRDSTAVKRLQQSNVKITLSKALEIIRSGGKTDSLSKSYQIVGNLRAYFNTRMESVYYGAPELFLNVIAHVGKVSDLLLESGGFSDYITGIARAVKLSDMWVRPYKDWKPKSHNADRQFSSFLRFLFAKYDVPLFFDNPWMGQIQESRFDNRAKWFIHVGQGQNIYTAPGFIDEYPMTKKMAHQFMQSPDTYTMDMAYRFAQVMSLGGNKRVAEALFATKVMGRVKTHEEFVLSLMKFFIANPMLDFAHYGPIIDYIWYHKYESHQVHDIQGRIINAPPEQPNLSMNGRNADTLLAQVEAWHKKLGKEKKGVQVWVHSKFHDIEITEGEKENRKTYRIQELLSAKELSYEGRHMHHCVGSYSQSCAHGSVSIWSLSVESKSLSARLVTIEVRNSSRQICQIRGQYNRVANQKEMSVIKRWASREGLSVSSYVQ